MREQSDWFLNLFFIVFYDIFPVTLIFFVVSTYECNIELGIKMNERCNKEKKIVRKREIYIYLFSQCYNYFSIGVIF